MDIIEELKKHDKDDLNIWINLDDKSTKKFSKDIVKFATQNPEAVKQYCINTKPKEFSSLSIIYEALSEYSVAWNSFLLEEVKRVISLAKSKRIKPEYIEVLEDIETEDIYSKDENLYIEIIDFITSSLHINNDKKFNLQILSLLDWFLIEYDEDDSISEVENWIISIKNIAENAIQSEVREEAKEVLENLSDNISYNDNDLTLKSSSFLTKLKRLFK